MPSARNWILQLTYLVPSWMRTRSGILKSSSFQSDSFLAVEETRLKYPLLYKCSSHPVTENNEQML